MNYDDLILQYIDEIRSKILLGQGVGGKKDLVKSLAACLGETIVIEATNGKSYNADGFDVITEDVKQTEVKTALLSSGDDYIAAYGLLQKRNKCDQFAIVDMNTRRLSIIPHDIMFEYLDEGTRNGKQRTDFRWSKSYNTKDKIRVKETELFLKYEVTMEVNR